MAAIGFRVNGENLGSNVQLCKGKWVQVVQVK